VTGKNEYSPHAQLVQVLGSVFSTSAYIHESPKRQNLLFMYFYIWPPNIMTFKISKKIEVENFFDFYIFELYIQKQSKV
jgi:hypothetical protein